ncbi:unnamed protein product [Ceratitis capitata]|uniref:(Mediterranean fruit fly) hypothetical protein n=1 Tax=Ceratitis capitata TaxID=7213 RepID=A0A811UMI5_CERCA|nr:unnamed protein product [Ceratitis capitata]
MPIGLELAEPFARDKLNASSPNSKDLSPTDLTDDQQQHLEREDHRFEETDIEMEDDTITRDTGENRILPTNPHRISPSSREENEMSRSPSVTAANSSNSADAFPSEHKIELNIEPEKLEEPTELSIESTSPNPNDTRPASRSSPHKDLLTAGNETPPTASPTSILPKLRLNALLASDPALKPDAKDLKVLHEETQSKNRLAQLPPPPALTKQEDIDAMMNAPVVGVVEPVLKTAAAAAQTTANPAEIAPRLKLFVCLPCGIHFSSPSTLEAHQLYYCSHRNKDMEADADSLSTVIAEKSTGMNANTTNSTSGNIGSSNSSGEPAAKAIKTGKQYACTQCSYSADKKVSLNRHMRMHQTSPAHSSSAPPSNGAVTLDDGSSSQQTDRYCSDCDIRFNNVKTYRAHKLHYCSSRRTEGQLTPKLEVSTGNTIKAPIGAAAISPQTRTKTPTPAMVAAAAAAAAAASIQASPPQPFLALPTNPILIIPCSLIRAASWIPGPLSSVSTSISNPDTTCYVLDNGNLKPLATALNMSSLSANAAASGNNANNIVASAANLNNPQMPTVETPPARQPSQPSNEAINDAPPIERNAGRGADRSGTSTPKRKEGARESAPLDLSLRRSPISYASLQRQRAHSASSYADSEQQRMDMETLLEASKENLSMDESGTVTPEQIVCAPSLPNSPSMSPSPKRRAISPRSSGAGSTSSMSPPVNVSTASLVAAAASNMLDLPLRSMLPTDLAVKLSESNIMNPLLAKQNFELALKLSAVAAAAVNNSSPANVGNGSTHAELAAAAVAAAAGKSSLLGMPVLGSTAPTGNNASVGGGAGAAVQPQIYVKQGVSKCKECNIVFCKYENYLAHKQHYCSARNQESSEGGEAKTANTSPIGIVGGATNVEATPVAYQQLICAACGIKYTSLDNLRAHQNYYCPKGGGTAAGAANVAAAAATADAGQLPLAKEKCGKCKTIHEMGLPCPPPPTLQQSPSGAQHLTDAANINMAALSTISASNQNVYKCPVCDVVSLSATESRKHMETHGTVKAFRCSICRYKGNTLRGMRTHIRMHFDKKATDLNEEHYMSCILEDEGLEIPSIASTLNQEQLAQQIAAVQHQQLQLQAQQRQQQQQQQQQIFNCDLCNYSSSYKGNVLRHMKLVHPHININSPSISPEANDLDNADLAGLNGESGTFSIKSEPLDSATNANPTQLLDNNNTTILASTLTAPPPLNSLGTEAMPHIKTEPLDIAGDTLPAATTLLPPPPLNSPAIGPPPPLNAATDENATAAAVNLKYCQTCDISFNYMKTYVAHKQYYCKNKLLRPEASDSPSPNAGLMPMALASPNSLMLMQKNKENLQQEAAI